MNGASWSQGLARPANSMTISIVFRVVRSNEIAFMEAEGRFSFLIQNQSRKVHAPCHFRNHRNARRAVPVCKKCIRKNPPC
jgi:hypothetical protein